MNQRHHIESLIIVAVAAYAAKHFSRKHSERRELCSGSYQISYQEGFIEEEEEACK
jgi:hypothetical protein